MKMLEQRDWLAHNYLTDTEEARGLLDCIFTQDDWKALDVRSEQMRATRWGEDNDPAFVKDDDGVDGATAFALTALVECHEGPHIARCYYAKGASA